MEQHRNHSDNANGTLPASHGGCMMTGALVPADSEGSLNRGGDPNLPHTWEMSRVPLPLRTLTRVLCTLGMTIRVPHILGETTRVV